MLVKPKKHNRTYILLIKRSSVTITVFAIGHFGNSVKVLALLLLLYSKKLCTKQAITIRLILFWKPLLNNNDGKLNTVFMKIWYWFWQKATKFMIIIRFIDSSLDIFDRAFYQQTIWNNINLTANKVNLLLNKYWTVHHTILFSIKGLKSLIYEIWNINFVIDCNKSLTAIY